MNSTLNVQLVFPIVLLIIQTYILLFGSVFLMRRLGILKIPFSDLEVSQVIVASAVLVSIFYISTADYSPLLQSFKTFLNGKVNVHSLTFLGLVNTSSMFLQLN